MTASRVRRNGRHPGRVSYTPPMTHTHRTLAVLVLLCSTILLPALAEAQNAKPGKTPSGAASLDVLHQRIDQAADALLPKVVAWRRDFHQHPELGNRETRTAKVIADELRRLGYDVKTGVAHTGVVA